MVTATQYKVPDMFLHDKDHLAMQFFAGEECWRNVSATVTLWLCMPPVRMWTRRYGWYLLECDRKLTDALKVC
ncbi:hypothetical protein AV530_007862 [Patagioenas fasciata monilis]|uniref:Uncharacterized protein n=1 Tax=Patagioenas fasciata monilis TaxID=372326 RepID=A0A1V4JT52_PATFA|nr:hypothetical protein AV530_007862 [Patagioenas fasciata monilis]